MKKLIAALALSGGLALMLLLALSSLAARLSPPPFDPVAYERQQIAIERMHALAPVETFAAGLATLLPVLALAVGLLYLASLGVAHVARFRRERRPDARGLLPLRADDQDAARLALGGFHTARIEDARRALVPHSLNYSPHHSVDYRGEPGRDALPAPVEPAPLSLPGLTDLAALNFWPSKERILLGLAEGGELLTVPAKALCHVALVGATGGGKSNLLRLILPQLQAMGAQVVLADPHFAPTDLESGEDWRGIASRLHMAPAVTTGERGEIARLFAYLSGELQRRKDARLAGRALGPPMFLALDELPVIADKVPGAIDQLGDLLREGRKFGLYTVGAAQSMLVKVIGGDSSAREAYRTAFYVGGDLRSAAALLDMPQASINEAALGAGVAYLRSTATRPAQLVRVPYASNEGVARLLGGVSEVSEPRPLGFRATPDRTPDGHPMDTSGAQASSASLSPEAASVLAMFRAGLDVPQIVKELYQIDPSGGGRRYQDAARAVQRLLREAMQRGEN